MTSLGSVKMNEAVNCHVPWEQFSHSAQLCCTSRAQLRYLLIKATMSRMWKISLKPWLCCIDFFSSWHTMLWHLNASWEGNRQTTWKQCELTWKCVVSSGELTNVQICVSWTLLVITFQRSCHHCQYVHWKISPHTIYLWAGAPHCSQVKKNHFILRVMSVLLVP